MTSAEIIGSLFLIGKSSAMQQVYKMIGRICNADCAVLLTGEKGSGRETVAKAVHFYSHRSSIPFIEISGSKVTESSDEEILGLDETHQDQGSCYVKEFRSLPALAQDQLLSIHLRKEYRCNHINKFRKHNIRFIVENEDGMQEEADAMPIDSFYDWNFIPLYIPPLRERKEDIPLLASHFLERRAAAMHLAPKQLSPEALEVLLAYDWPGNVAELKSLLASALSKCHGHYIKAEHLEELQAGRADNSDTMDRLETFLSSRLTSYIENSPASFQGNLFRLLLPEMEKSLFDFVLKKSKGNKNKAAQILGLHRNTLNKKLQNYSE